MWDHTEAENLMFMSLSTLHNSCYNYIKHVSCLETYTLPFKTQNTHFCRWLNLSKHMRFLGGPNRPKICVGRTKPDIKDRVCAFYILKALHLWINLDSAEHFCCILWCVKNMQNFSVIICFKIRHLVVTTWHRFWNNKRKFRRKSI